MKVAHKTFGFIKRNKTSICHLLTYHEKYFFPSTVPSFLPSKMQKRHAPDIYGDFMNRCLPKPMFISFSFYV